MKHRYLYSLGWQSNKDPLKVFAVLWLVLFTQPRPGLAQTKDSLQGSMPTIKTEPHLSFQLSSGFGANAASGGNVLWDVTLMLGTPIFNNDGILWVGIIPTLVPEAIGDEAAADGFTPFVIEYEHDFHGSSVMPFVYANAGVGPQFGDRSNNRLFQAAMCSAGAGIRDGAGSGFFGQLGITYNNVPITNAREFLILNAGIFF